MRPMAWDFSSLEKWRCCPPPVFPWRCHCRSSGRPSSARFHGCGNPLPSLTAALRLLLSLLFVLLFLLLPIPCEAVAYPTLLNGGTCLQPFVCPCQDAVDYNGSSVPSDITLLWKPSTNPLPPTSAWTGPSTINSLGLVNTLAVVNGRPLPPLVLQFVRTAATRSPRACVSSTPYISNDAATATPVLDPIASFDATVFISNRTMRAVADDRAVRWSFSDNITYASNGEITLTNLTIWGTTASQVYFVVNSSVGLWAVSPLLLIFNDTTTVEHTLRLIETGDNWFSSLACFGASHLALDKRINAVVMFTTLDISQSVVTTFDGLPILINASFDSATLQLPLVVSVQSAPSIRNGRTTVSGITVTMPGTSSANPPPYYAAVRLTFTVGSMMAATRYMTLVPSPMPAYGLRFSAFSYVQGPRAEVAAARSFGAPSPTVSVQIGVPMRTVTVEVVESTGFVDTLANGFVIQATCATATVSGATAQVRNGVARFDALVFQSVTNGATYDHFPILTFSAVPSNSVVLRVPLYSQRVQVIPSSSGYRRYAVASLQLQPYQNQLLPLDNNFYVPFGAPFPLPIVIRILGQDGNIDPLARCTVVLWSPLVRRYAFTATPVAGVATLNNVSLENGTVGMSTFFTFTCETSATGNSTAATGNLGVVLATMTMDNVVLMPASAARIQFATHPFTSIHPLQDRLLATHGVSLPQVVVEIVDWGGNVLSTVDDVEIVATATVNATGASVFSKRGRAVFAELTLYCDAELEARGCTTALSFAAVASTSSAASFVNEQRITIGTVVVAAPTTVPRFGLSFLPNSFLAFPSQPLVLSFGFRVFPIGVGIVDSSNLLDTTAQNVVINVTLSSGTLTGTTQIRPVQGEAWFSDLVVTTATAPLDARLKFCAVYSPVSSTLAAAVRQSSPVLWKCISSGIVTFQLPALPAQVTLYPTQSADGTPLVDGANQTNLVIVNSTTQRILFQPGVDALLLRVAVQNAAGRYVLPTSTVVTGVRLRTSLSWQNESSLGFLLLDTRPVHYPVPPFAEFSNVRLTSAAELVCLTQGVTDVVTVVADWLPNRPLHLGGVSVSSGAIDPALVAPVVVAIVTEAFSRFDVAAWFASLALQLRIDASLLELVRVRPCAAAASGKVPLWSATKVVFHFRVPSTAQVALASPASLANRFLAADSECQQDDLRIAYRYAAGTAGPICDLLELEEQVVAAQMCYIAVGDVCSCFMPVFSGLPASCYEVDMMSVVCTQTQRCAAVAIQDGCKAYNSSVTLQYVMIGVYCLIAVLAVALIYLWRKEVFARCLRDNLGNRNRRDIEYQGLQMSRVKGETVEPDSIVF